MTTAELLRSDVPEAFIKQALEQADPNALRLALYQLTGDPALLAMRVTREPVWGGAVHVPALAPEHHEEVRRRTLALLKSGPTPTPPPPPVDARKALMEAFAGEAVSEAFARFGNEELAFDDHPRDVRWTSRPAQAELDKYMIVIVGCGVSGIAAGVLLTRLGIPYVILEKEPVAGGTWQINSYPECRVDVPSQLYQYKFDKKYSWRSNHPTRDENLTYLQHIMDTYGVSPNVRYSTKVVSAHWDDGASAWVMATEGPEGADVLEANFVLNATGQFSRANLPDIPDLESFAGDMFHSALWRHDVSLAGKRVGLIGNGSTGTQMTGYIAERARSLAVFMRTPNWIVPRENYTARVTAEQQWLLDNLPYYWNWLCYSVWLGGLQGQGLTIYDPAWIANGGQINEGNDRLRAFLSDYIRTKVGGDETRAAPLIPSYAPLGRRLVVDNGWYDALNLPNVDLITTGIERFVPEGLITRDGRLQELDCVVLSCGFKVYDYAWPIDYRGRNRLSLADAWRADGPRAYFSMMLPDFPNFFMFYGPNGQQRGGSFHQCAEMWARYAVTLIVRLIETGQESVEVTSEAHLSYNQRLDEALKKSIRSPEHSAGSYFINPWGRPSVDMPWLAEEWHQMMYEPNFGDLIIRGSRNND